MKYRKRLLKLFIPAVWFNTINALLGKKIIAYWWRGKNNRNWGDKINTYIIELLSDKKVVHADDVFNIPFLIVHTCIGSIISLLKYKNVYIWGSGIIKKDASLKINPKKIYAVRGPLTRKYLIDNGCDCPEIYGDPTLLMPKFYKPKVKKDIKLGIIPHYVDRDNQLILKLQDGGSFIIDIFSEKLEFIDQVNRCINIVSSSLHGLIVAEAYGISTKWIKISDLIVGDGFKYKDYYQSIGIVDEEPFVLNDQISQREIIEQCWKKEMKIDLNLLLKACPFYDGNLRL